MRVGLEDDILTRLFIVLMVWLFVPNPVAGFDGSLEGRVVLGSVYVPDSPLGFKDFDSEAELRLGVMSKSGGPSLNYPAVEN